MWLSNCCSTKLWVLPVAQWMADTPLLLQCDFVMYQTLVPGHNTTTTAVEKSEKRNDKTSDLSKVFDDLTDHLLQALKLYRTISKHPSIFYCLEASMCS